MDCSHSKDCQLYAQFAMEPSLRLWKQRYCVAEFKQCARYQLALEGKSVPLALLPNGRRVKQRSKEQISAAALFNAILKQRVPMVKSMLKTGLPSERVMSSDGMTPLMVSATVGNVELVEIMLKHGCNPYATNTNGESALDIALTSGFERCARIIEQARSTMTAEEYEVRPENSGKEAKTSVARTSGFFRRLNPFA
ncbi:MAG: ankyrin repeat domain-containing protein [Gammaproteobacteria bacterium]|nr:ankyrin repeat domain-containing protein [Gammaproteobacteria bacterium]